MKPLIVLLGTFLVALLVIRLVQGKFDWAQAARIGMSAMLVFTAIGHIVYTRGMEMMIPAFIPAKTAMVYGTGHHRVVGCDRLIDTAVPCADGLAADRLFCPGTTGQCVGGFEAGQLPERRFLRCGPVIPLVQGAFTGIVYCMDLLVFH